MLLSLLAQKPNFKIQETFYVQSEIPVFIYISAMTLSTELHLLREPRTAYTPSKYCAPTGKFLVRQPLQHLKSKEGIYK